MTGFIPPQDFRYANKGFVMLTIRGKDIPCSIKELEATDPDYNTGRYRIECRSTAVSAGDEMTVAGHGQFVAVATYDPYKTNPDKSMRGRFVAIVSNRKLVYGE